MDSLRKMRTKVFPDKERERKKLVRRSRSLPHMPAISTHPKYSGKTPLTVEQVVVNVPLKANDHRRVYDISRRPENTPTSRIVNNIPSTGPHPFSQPSTKLTPVKTPRQAEPLLNKPLPKIQKTSSTPQRVPRTAARKVEKPVPVPMPILKPVPGTYANRNDLINQFPSPPGPSHYQQNIVNHAEKVPFLARGIRRPTDPMEYIPPDIPAFDSRSRIKEIRIQMEEADLDPFRRIIPTYPAAGSTTNLFRSASTSSRAVRQELPESWSELGNWSGYRTGSPPVHEPINGATTFMRHNNISSKSLGPNVVFKDSPARQPVLIHKKSSSFATPGYWPEPHQARLPQNVSAPQYTEPLARSSSRKLPRVGDNTSRTRHNDESIMQSTGSVRSVQSNISALSRAKKLPKPLQREAPSSNMLSSGSAKSFMSLRSNVSPRVETKPSRNILHKLMKPEGQKVSSSSNMLSTGSMRSMLSTRSNLIPDSEKKSRPSIKLPIALQPFKRRA